MKKNIEFWILGAIVAPLVYLGFIWRQLPATVPTHFGLNGQPDQYGSKWTLVLFAGVQMFLYFLLRYIPRIDPRADTNTLSEHYPKLRLLITVFMSVVHFVIIQSSIERFSGDWMLNVIFVGVFLLIAGIGNYLNNIKPNYFVGIRTPWTLESPQVWRKTHQLASKMFFGAGIVGALVVIWLPPGWKVVWVLGLTLGVALWAGVYSYRLFQRERKSEKV